jgi:Sortase domain
MPADQTAARPARVPSERRLRRIVIGAALTGFLAAGALAALAVNLGHEQPIDDTSAVTIVKGRPHAPEDSPTRRSAASQAAATSQVGSTPARSAGTDVSQIENSGSLLIIPALNVRAPLVPTGAVGAPGTASLTIPADIHSVGWWDGMVQDGDRADHEDAPAPGEPGVAVIAGHVDSAAAGPGALYDLKDLKPGDTIQVSDSSNHLTTWIVDAAPDLTAKTELPATLWATTGAPRLVLITCGGTFDTNTGHYRDNVIVWTHQLPSPH